MKITKIFLSFIYVFIHIQRANTKVSGLMFFYKIKVNPDITWYQLLFFPQVEIWPRWTNHIRLRLRNTDL